VLPSVTQIFVDQVLTKRLTAWIFWLVLGLFAAALLNGVLFGMQEYFLRRIESRLAILTGSRLFWRFLTVPLLYYSTNSVGDAAARLDAANRLASLLSNRMGRCFTNIVLALVYGGMLMLYSAVLAGICIGLTLLSVVMARVVGGKRARLNAAQLRQLGQVSSIGMLGLQAIETLKAMGTETFFFRNWAEANTRAVNSQQHIDALSITLDLAPQALAAVVSATALGFGAVLVIRGHMTIGALIAFQMLLTRFSRPVADLINATQDAQEVVAQLRRVDESLHVAPDPVTRPRADDAAPPRKLSGLVELRNIADEIAERGHTHTARIFALGPHAPDAAFGGTPLYHSAIVHYENGDPIQFESRLVNPALAPDYLQQDFTKITPNEYLVRVAPLQEVAHDVQAIPAAPPISQHLDLSPGEPVLLVTRRTWSANALAALTHLYHPGSKFMLTGHFNPQSK